jgi:uncharacterized protein (UPF0332 family)
MLDPETQQAIRGYLARSRQMIDTGRLTLEHQDYISAVNRAYYAVFYAANALLATRHMERSKHSGVIAAFREHFVKTGLIEPEYSDWYGETLDARQRGDYTLDLVLDEARAQELIEQAERFADRVERYLREQGSLR